MKKKLEAVIFDLDGVIADTVELYYQAGKRLADELGIEFDRDMNQKIQGINRYAGMEMMLGDKLNEFSKEEVHRLGDLRSEYYRELIATISPENVLPGMSQLLQELKNAGTKTGIASSSSNASVVVEKLEVGQFIDFIVDIKQVKKGKPDPEIFLSAAEALGVGQENCVAIEDGEAGLTGILQTGMFSVGIGVHEEMKKAHWHVQSTSEITYSNLVQRWEQYQLSVK